MFVQGPNGPILVQSGGPVVQPILVGQPQPQFVSLQPQFVQAPTVQYGAPIGQPVIYQAGPQYGFPNQGPFFGSGPLPPGYVQVLNPDQAATKIQSVYRGYTVRKELEEKKDPAPAAAPAFVVDQQGGTLKIQVMHAEDIPNVQCCLRQDPYVRIRIGAAEVKTETQSSGHTNPRWNGTPFFLDLSKRDASNIIPVEIMNDNFFCDDLIGRVDIDVKEVLAAAAKDQKEYTKKLHVQSARAGHSGYLTVSLLYIPPLVVKVCEATKLPDTQRVGKQDPYVKLSYRGRLAVSDDGRRRSVIHNDGDKHPVWNETFKFAVGSEFMFDPKKEEKEPELTLEVYNDNIVVDAAIAYVTVPFSKLMKIKADKKRESLALCIGAVTEGGRAYGGDLSIEVS